MEFYHPWILWLLLLVPVVIFLHLRPGRTPALRFSSLGEVRHLRPSVRSRLRWAVPVMRGAVLVLLVVAMARPRQGVEEVREVTEGVAIEMIVDRSSSMGAEMSYGGEGLNRFEVVKRVFEEFVAGNDRGLEGRPNDLIGMIAFARYAETICPLVHAHGTLLQFMQSAKLVEPRSPEDSTSIGDALALSAARLKTAEEEMEEYGQARAFSIKSKIIILLTDGINNSGKRDPVQAAEMAADWGVKVYAIGIGGREGMGRIKTLFGRFAMPLGQGVDEKTLKAIAQKTGGRYWTAEDAEALRSIYEEIDQLEKTEIESVRYMDYEERFLPFALAALLLLLAEVILANTIFRRVP